MMEISPSYMEFEYPSIFSTPSPSEKNAGHERSYCTKHLDINAFQLKTFPSELFNYFHVHLFLILLKTFWQV